MPLIANEILDRVASMLNDMDKDVYSYNAQLPHLKAAYDEIFDELAKNSVTISNEDSIPISVPAHSKFITPSAIASNFFYPMYLSERSTGQSNKDWTPMFEKMELPVREHELETLDYWAWQEQEIKLLGATTDRQVLVRYKKFLDDIVDQNSAITPLNSRRFLSLRTAEHCARYIGENDSRADSLASKADIALRDLMIIAAKQKQVTPVRRIPFGAWIRGGRRG